MPSKIIKNPTTEAADAEFIVCFRVADLPIPYVPAQIMACTECGARVWLADNSPQNVPIICDHCAKIAIAKDGEEPMLYMTERQARSIGGRARVQELLDVVVKAMRPK